jgi:hypothetical protein
MEIDLYERNSLAELAHTMMKVEKFSEGPSYSWRPRKESSVAQSKFEGTRARATNCKTVSLRPST